MSRALISEATRDALVAAAIVPVGHVWRNRLAAFGAGEYPALNVLIPSTNDQTRSINVQIFARSISIVVEAWLEGSTDAELDDALGELADDVQAALLSSDTWTAQFERVESCAIEYHGGVDAGRRRAAAKLTFTARYNVEFTAAAVAAAVDLDSVAVTADLDGTGSAPTVASVIPIEVAP